MYNNNQKPFKLYLDHFSHLILLMKYNFTSKRYNIFIINNIIFNINCKKVSHIKDFLIFYDPNDFLRRFYFIKESYQHLKYYISFYEENNKIFPNYCFLSESKYIYKNIRQKQHILNNIEIMNNGIKKKKESYSTIFSSSIKKSIYNESLFTSNSNGEEELIKLIKTINLLFL